MRILLALLPLLAFGTAASGRSPAGHYRLVGEQDAASELALRPNGRFQYFLIYGALDEQAEGRWSVAGGVVTLVTEPRPVPPEFSRNPSGTTGSDPLSVRVRWPDGR